MDVICAWFEQMGLFMYIADVRRHLRAGNQLLEVSFHLIFILSHCDVLEIENIYSIYFSNHFLQLFVLGKQL